MNWRNSYLLALLCLATMAFSTGSVLAAGKFASPVQNTVTLSFDDPAALSPGMTPFKNIDPNSNFDTFRNWDDSYAGEIANWGSFGGAPTEIFAGVVADAGPNGTGDNAARLYLPSNDGLGSYYANLLWQVKGLQLGNTYGGMVTDSISGDIPVPTDGDSNGQYLGISLSASVKTDVPSATFRFNIDTGTTRSFKSIDDEFGGTYNWVTGNVPGLIEQSRTGSRVYLVDPGDLPVNTWSSTLPGIVSDLADLDAIGWSNPNFDPFQGKGVRSFDLTRIGVTFPGGGQVGELLVGDITLSGPDVLKYHAADFNYDEMVDDADIDMLFAAILGADLNDTLFEPPFGALGDYAWEPVWGVDHILNARQALTEKFSLTKSDTDIVDVLDSGDVDELVLNILGTSYGDLDLNGAKNAGDRATLVANLNTPGGWADGDLNGDKMVNSADLTIFDTTTGVPGDYNGNNVVDAADYTVWRDHLGLMGGATAAQGDGTGDGNVTQADYDYWKARFGNTSGSGAAAGSVAVPEPGTLVLLASVVAIGMWRHEARRSR